MKYIALICARSNSKGVPGKNIKFLGGMPLIAWSIKTAKSIECISKVIVSTDSLEIAKIASEFGAEVPFIRPAELAEDDSPEWLVWRHAIDYIESTNQKIDGLIVIPPTAPLRSSQDVISCIKQFEKGDVDTIITVCNASRSPYFNMIKKNHEGLASLVITPENNISRRQDSPEVFDMTTVAYIIRPKFLKENNGIFDGRVKSVDVPPERAIDIDTILDFEIAEFLHLNQNRSSK